MTDITLTIQVGDRRYTRTDAARLENHAEVRNTAAAIGRSARDAVLVAAGLLDNVDGFHLATAHPVIEYEGGRLLTDDEIAVFGDALIADAAGEPISAEAQEIVERLGSVTLPDGTETPVLEDGYPEQTDGGAAE